MALMSIYKLSQNGRTDSTQLFFASLHQAVEAAPQSYTPSGERAAGGSWGGLKQLGSGWAADGWAGDYETWMKQLMPVD